MNVAKSVRPNPDIVVATAHSLKGLEFSTVYIASDMLASISEIMVNGGPQSSDDIQELNLYYVAMTRARNKLII